MHLTAPIVAALLLLSACASPLAEVERLSEVPLADAASAGALPGPGETEDDPGVVGGLIAGARGDVDGQRVAPGQVLPFGRIGLACGLSNAQLGTRIAAEAGYAIYDTNPATAAPRTHYVTGFRDGCARQVTAALAMFGDLAMHETVRYATPGAPPYGAVDVAYEELKARVCGARSGQPCGARLDRLAADTAFVSVYPVFGGPASAEILLHRGAVVAAEF